MVVLVKNGDRWQVVSSQLTDSAPSQPVAVDEKSLNQFMDDYFVALLKNSADAVGPFFSDDYASCRSQWVNFNERTSARGDAFRRFEIRVGRSRGKNLANIR